MKYNYYYNNVQGVGLCRNNLIYTSLISEDKKTFVQWFFNDKNYHKNQNEVVDQELMDHKWNREIKFLTLMSEQYPEHSLKIEDINYEEKKIFLNIEDVDFWELSGTLQENYSKTLDNWEDQMLEIFRAYKSLNMYKFSIHPSSYFIVNNKLKAINYFFAYDNNDEEVAVKDVLSHISFNRREQLYIHMNKLGIDIDKKTPFSKLQFLCFDSFSTNYPFSFINKLKKLYE